ncbi:hypothetical protein QFZ60_003253 [Arthrobacter sp. B2I5]|nr:hypothetical protein [Arthrobacter sp. B2I5]MDQ0827080.1 hypothetical protein [Arthrobacter sp. B2I5]
MPAMQIDRTAGHQAVKARQVLDFEGAGTGTKASGVVHRCCPTVHIMEPA